MSTLSEVWGQVTALLADGISIIPVRDKDEGVMVAKSPYGKWKEFQTRQITKEELWHEMEEKNTSAIGIVCGKISGNMEVIDIDVKYNPGIDAILFRDMREFYPDLYPRLRIHKTPSTGYHIVYRVTGNDVPGNLKLAGRMATEGELALQVQKGMKRPNKEVNFLETRGEGGYILAPPSMGYAVHQNVPIPVITWAERCSLITLCQSYNTIIREVPRPKVTKSEDSFYDENPFEHFNRTVDPTLLIEGFGWKFSHENKHFIWYTRPGKTSGVSASWNLDKKIFYIFTASTELQSERGYHPSTILAELQFAGDKSKTYHHLVQNGYGQIKKRIELSLVKNATISGSSGPANLSVGARETLIKAQIAYTEDHPHGLFWETNEEGKMAIDREGIYTVSHGLGFRLHNQSIVKINGIYIHKQLERDYFDSLKEYIREEDANIYKEICNAYEAFIQKAGQFSITRLRILDTAAVLSDGPDWSYKFYLNLFIKITSESITQHPYDSVGSNLIWGDKIFPREWSNNPPQQFKYSEFLHLAIGITEPLLRAIGYLAHDYKDEDTGYIITLTEKCPDPKQGGGSGKNIFGNLFRHITAVHTVSGSQVQLNEKFLQSWNFQRVLFIADIPKKFDFGFLKEISTGYGTIKKLFKDEISLCPKDMPKILTNTNFSFDAVDGGLKRRIIPIEFTDFFTKSGGVDAHFNCMFPAGWTTEDWAGFDHLHSMCLQKYFIGLGKLQATELSHTGWEKQFKQKYGELTLQFIEENIEEWKVLHFIRLSEFTDLYNKFCTANNISQQYRATSILINKALTDYCEKFEIPFDAKGQKKRNSIKENGKTFGIPLF